VAVESPHVMESNDEMAVKSVDHLLHFAEAMKRNEYAIELHKRDTYPGYIIDRFVAWQASLRDVLTRSGDDTRKILAPATRSYNARDTCHFLIGLSDADVQRLDDEARGIVRRQILTLHKSGHFGSARSR
jgi:hypothetical protein